jgi:hypothetical protein
LIAVRSLGTLPLRAFVFSESAGVPYWFTVDTFNENGITRMSGDFVFIG